VTDPLLADERAMAKTISCVFHNALKFTETGRISLDVKLSPSSQTLVIVIADTGSGIPVNFQEKIFKAYSQADESITRHSEGLGLGLLIAKGLAHKMGGDLDLIRSNIDGPNKGTVSALSLAKDDVAVTYKYTRPLNCVSLCHPHARDLFLLPALQTMPILFRTHHHMCNLPLRPLHLSRRPPNQAHDI